MSKYSLQSLFESMSDEEFSDAQAFDRLSKDDQDKLAMIRQMMAKEKSIDTIKAISPKADRKSLEKLAKMEEDLFSKDGGNEDNVDNIDKVASPSAKGTGYKAAVDSERSESGKEQSDITQTTKPMYEDMSLMSLAKKLGIDVKDLKDRVSKMQSKEKDEIEASAKASMAEVRIDRDVAERIEGMLDRSMKAKFIDAFMDIYDDLLEEDNFFPEDIINHLNNEMHAELAGYQRQGDKLAGIGENGHVSDYADEIKEDDKKKSMDAAAKMIKDRILKDIPMDIVVDFVKTHFDDIKGMDNSEIKDEFKEFRSVNYDYIDEDKKMEDLKEQFKRFR